MPKHKNQGNNRTTWGKIRKDSDMLIIYSSWKINLNAALEASIAPGSHSNVTMTTNAQMVI